MCDPWRPHIKSLGNFYSDIVRCYSGLKISTHLQPAEEIKPRELSPQNSARVKYILIIAWQGKKK